ncbi:hypothetical protein ACMFMG_002138 [Clarireedia jacksonii]
MPSSTSYTSSSSFTKSEISSSSSTSLVLSSSTSEVLSTPSLSISVSATATTSESASSSLSPSLSLESSTEISTKFSSIIPSSTSESSTSVPAMTTYSELVPSITPIIITTTVISTIIGVPTTIQGERTTVSIITTFTQVTTVALPTTIGPSTVLQYTTVFPPSCTIHPSLINGGFEQGLPPWNTNDTGSSSHSLNTNPSNSHGGSNSLHLTFPANSGPSDTITAGQQINVCPGSNYLATGYVLGDAGLLASSDTCHVYLESSGQSSIPATVQAAGGSSWADFYLFFTAPAASASVGLPEAATLTLHAYCTGSNGNERGVYVDDLVIMG